MTVELTLIERLRFVAETHPFELEASTVREAIAALEARPDPVPVSGEVDRAQIEREAYERLAELRAKATRGPWECQETQFEGPDAGVAVVAGNLGGLVGAALPCPTEIDSGNMERVEANAAFIVALVNWFDSLTPPVQGNGIGEAE